MDLLIIVSAVLVGVLGVIGSIVPVLPGPPLGLAALGLLYFLFSAKFGKQTKKVPSRGVRG